MRSQIARTKSVVSSGKDAMWCFAGDFIVQIMITFADYIRYVIVNRIGDFFQNNNCSCNDVTFPHLGTRWL